MTATLVGLCVAALGYAFIAYILLRYPDLRRAFVAHWRPSAVAERMQRWAEKREQR